MARHTLLPDILTAFEGSEPACATDPIDEYRDLAMLARAWERIGSGGVAADDAGILQAWACQAFGRKIRSAGEDVVDMLHDVPPQDNAR